MKISTPIFSMAILFCALAIAFSWRPVRAAVDGAELGTCEFTTAAPKTEKDKPPQYKAVPVIQCGKFTELYAVCMLPKPIGEYQGGAVNAKILFNDVNPDAQHIIREAKPGKNPDMTARAWITPYENCEQQDCSDKTPVDTDVFNYYEETIRPMSGMDPSAKVIIYGLIPNEKAAVTMRAWMTAMETCELTGRNENKSVDVVVFISTGVRTDTEKQKEGDDSGEEGDRESPDYDWTTIASGRLKLIPEQQNKTPRPPNWESVKDELRTYWPTRYPGFEFIDGYPSDEPRVDAMNGDAIFTYKLSVIVTDADGVQSTCAIDDAAIKVLETGAIIVHNIEFDRLQDCSN